MQTTATHSPNVASQRRGGAGAGAGESVPAAALGDGGILDRPLPKQRGEVSESAYLYLFSEVVQYCQTRAQTPDEFKERLAAVGHSMGVRHAELLAYRGPRLQRFTDLTEALKFVSSTAWKALFGKEADGLEKVTGSKSTCLLSFLFHSSFLWHAPLTTRHTQTTSLTTRCSSTSMSPRTRARHVPRLWRALCRAFWTAPPSFVPALPLPSQAPSSRLPHKRPPSPPPHAQRVKVTPVRYATNPNNTASAKTYIRVQAVGDDDEVLA